MAFHKPKHEPDFEWDPDDYGLGALPPKKEEDEPEDIEHDCS